MHQDPKLIVLCGIPGSGKSTYRKELLKQYPDAVVISSDDYIENFARASNKTYNEVFQFAVKQTGAWMDKLLEYAVGNNLTIIWDQTNLTARKRKGIIERVPAFYSKEAVFLDVDLKTALERNAKRDRSIPEYVIENMYLNSTPPTFSEGFRLIKTTWPDGHHTIEED